MVASVEAEVVTEVEEEVPEVDLVSQLLHSDKVKDKCSERNNGEYYNIINPYNFFGGTILLSSLLEENEGPIIELEY